MFRFNRALCSGGCVAAPICDYALDQLEGRQLFSFLHAGPPEAPSTIVATADGRVPFIRVTWSDNSGKEAGYTLQRRKGKHGAWFTVATLPPNTTYYRNARLPKGTLYSYRVAAFNRAGSSDFVGPASVMTEGGVTPPASTAPTLSGSFIDAGTQAAVRVAGGGPLMSVDYALVPGGHGNQSSYVGPVIRAEGTTTIPGGAIDINSELRFPMNSATGLAVQSDGKIIVAGNANADHTGNVIVARFNTDGSLDMTFNVGTGEFNADFGNQEHVADLAVAADGGIYVGGDHTVYGSNGNTHEFFAIRLTSAGITDNTYGFGGISKGDPHGGVFAQAMALDPTDGSVVIVGSSEPVFEGATPIALEGARLLPDGTGADAFTFQPGFPGSAVAKGVIVQTDHKIVIVGQNAFSPFDTRRNADGTKDSSWSFPPPTPGTLGIFNAVTQLTDGTYIVAGSETTGSATKAVIARLNTDGSPDGGYVLEGIPDSHGNINETYNALAINPDGSSANGSVSVAGGTHGTLALDTYTVPAA